MINLLTGCHTLSTDSEVASHPDLPWTAPENTQKVVNKFAMKPIAPINSALSLVDLVDMALAKNPKTRQSWARAQVAAANYGVGKAAFLPTGGVWVGAEKQNNQFRGDPNKQRQTLRGVALDLNWILFNFGARENELESLEKALFSANFSYNQSLQAVLLAVVSGYFNFNGAVEMVNARLASLEDAKTTLKSVEVKFHTGLVDLQQRLQAQSDYESKRYDLEAAYAEVEKVRADLAVAIGIPVNALMNIQTMADVSGQILTKEENVDTFIQHALEKRPELLAAYMEAESQQKHEAAAQKALYPYLVAGASWSKYHGVENNFQPAEQAQVSIGVQWNIFDLLTNHYELLAARAQAKQAHAAAQLEQLKVVSEVWSSFYIYKSALKQLDAALSFLKVAEESYEAIRVGYNTGINSLLDLLNAQDTLSLARFQKVNAHVSSVTSLAQLAYASGQFEGLGNMIQQ